MWRKGVRWLRDVVAMGAAVHEVYVVEGHVSAEILTLLTNVIAPQYSVTPQVMQAMSDLETPPGILLVLPLATVEFPTMPSFLLIMDRIQTPGNMGTLLRTAAAAGVDGVVLTLGCVDLYNPKVVRSAMGAQLRLAIIVADWDEIVQLIGEVNIYCASAESATRYSDVDWTVPSALIIGNEANGPSERARTLGTGISIPMANATESLNAAMAAGIILFEGGATAVASTVGGVDSTKAGASSLCTSGGLAPILAGGVGSLRSRSIGRCAA